VSERNEIRGGKNRNMPNGKEKFPRQSKRTMTYHGRSGKPVLHKATEGRRKDDTYIMVRKPSGGTERLYLDPHGNVPKRFREKKGGGK